MWKLTVLWKNQRTVFPQNLEPSVHSSHNAGCYWIFPQTQLSFYSHPHDAFYDGRDHYDHESMKDDSVDSLVQMFREEQEQQWADYIYDADRAYRAGLEEARAAALDEESEEEGENEMTDAEEKELTKEELAEIVEVLKENGRRFRAQMVAEGMPITMPVDLTDEDIEHAEHEAHEIISMYAWPVIWAIGAILGWKDGLGGAEYRRETAAREREESDANA